VDALIKLSTVATDSLGVSGRAMLEALIAGQRDPKVLVELARGRLRVKHAALVGGPHRPLRRASPSAGEDAGGPDRRLSGQLDQLTVLIEPTIAAICAAKPPAPAPGPGGGTAAAVHAGTALAGSVPGHPDSVDPNPVSWWPRPAGRGPPG
jgi:hypothetical protein